ncbi:MAG: TetR/AcrR family transcriptional regulator [Acidimicrobiia bacterium]|nr:MAG: TetR/AcrR family transcriptional regulator [Acidimicrobiia bacterium]
MTSLGFWSFISKRGTMTISIRDQLIEAAEQQFRRFGYRRTTVEDVTRTAEMGKGSFYLHFPSKEAAYMTVVEGSLERFLTKADTALHSPGSVPQRLRALVAVTADHYGNDELLRASLFGEAALVDGSVARRAAEIQRSEIRELLAEALAEGKRDGSIRTDLDVEATAAVLFEIGWAVVRSELVGSSDLPLEVALDTLNDIVGLGLIARNPEVTTP